ncbi:hypothetical protein GN244_ATG08005 [Phytophthora infestans]|uniref:Uncharacterized protein n=1 Tax=Phytophthora infestans TaxID=4787 RepID=A0A833TEZ8_PHYIN|nr:hypothetical protein GN244_ATG08005 [Phytophthora infestans]KAF4147868.1 hypothetical protein GN958_ATG02934 [Phytophthora infestans]
MDAGVGHDDEVRLASEVRADLGRDGAVEAQPAPTAEERLTAVNEDGVARSTDKSLRLEKSRDEIKSRQLEKASSPDGGAPAAESTRPFTRAVKRRLEAAKAPVVTTVEQQQSMEEATVRSEQRRVRFDLLGPDGTAKRPRTTAVVIERERDDGGRLEPTAVTARRRPARAEHDLHKGWMRWKEATRMSSVTQYGAPMVFKSPK